MKFENDIHFNCFNQEEELQKELCLQTTNNQIKTTASVQENLHRLLVSLPHTITFLIVG